MFVRSFGRTFYAQNRYSYRLKVCLEIMSSKHIYYYTLLIILQRLSSMI